jgi:hypothetical protein
VPEMVNAWLFTTLAFAPPRPVRYRRPPTPRFPTFAPSGTRCVVVADEMFDGVGRGVGHEGHDARRVVDA